MDSRTPDERVWTPYVERKPETAGEYLWRVPSRTVKGLLVQFVCHMRERGAGHRQALSPTFDYWDGYKLHVPAGTEWTTTEVKCKSHEYVGIALPGVDLLACPFCRVVPFWHGVNSSNHGVLIGAHPAEYNSWWLKCCSWASTPHYPDPRELAATRNAIITKGHV